MNERDEIRRDDKDLDDMRPRRRRDNDEDEDQPRRKSRRAQPTLTSFTVMLDFGKFYSTVDFSAPEGFTPDDVEDFVYDLKDNGYKVYKPFRKDKNGRGDSGRRGGRSYGRYDD